MRANAALYEVVKMLGSGLIVGVICDSPGGSIECIGGLREGVLGQFG